MCICRIYKHICIYVYMYDIYTRAGFGDGLIDMVEFMEIYICIYICIYIYMYVCMYVCTCILSLYVYMCVCGFVCVCASFGDGLITYFCIRVETYLHTYIHTYIYTYIYIYIHVQVLEMD